MNPKSMKGTYAVYAPRRILAIVVVAAAFATVTPTALAHQKHHATEAPAADESDESVHAAPTQTREVTEAPRLDEIDDAADASSKTARPKDGVLPLVGRLHPMATHFPIASFVLAAVAEALFAATRSLAFRHTVRFLVWAAAIGATGAAPLGWAFASTAATETGWLLETHRWAGTSAALAGLLVLWLCERAERMPTGRVVFRIGLAAQVLLIGVTGYLGGSLLYGIDHLWPVS